MLRNKPQYTGLLFCSQRDPLERNVFICKRWLMHMSGVII